MNIFVSGGLGFIGSHTVLALLEAQHRVTIVDNLSNAERSVLDRIGELSSKAPRFVEADTTDAQAMDAIFASESFDAIVHFSGYKAVGESVEKPLMYYRNNVLSTLTLVECALRYGVTRFIFSSSATVYGEQRVPYRESQPLLKTSNPYGETKAMSERILSDTAQAHPSLSVSLLRYFNPIGAHPSGLLGEVPKGTPNNLMPYITQVASGQRSHLNIYGNDYDTPDGTGVRDYIHVMDLAEGHVAALNAMTPGVHLYNLGTGQGTSVLELIETFKRVNHVDVPYQIVERRPGDLASSYADVSKAHHELKWSTQRSLEDMVRDAWNFEQKRTGQA
jgi:UDP-glucose 4-epimerase